MRVDSWHGSGSVPCVVERFPGGILFWLAVVAAPVLGPAAARAAECPGDLNRDGRVRIEEIVSVVHVALDGCPASGTCPGDLDGDHQIGIDELIRIVGAALNGCATPTPSPPTPPASRTRTASATATRTPKCGDGNLCASIRSPGFWKNYDNHMSDAHFLAIIQATQDYAGLSIAQALTILGNTGDQYHRHLLSAELNAAWNGNESMAAPGGALGGGIYSNPAFPTSSLNGLSVNAVAHIAFTTSAGSAGDDLVAFVLYVGADGENASGSTCRVTPASCRTPTPTASRTTSATRTGTATASRTPTSTASATPSATPPSTTTATCCRRS